jgi:hypothetical protein
VSKTADASINLLRFRRCPNQICGTAEPLSLIVVAEVEGGNVHRGIV